VSVTPITARLVRESLVISTMTLRILNRTAIQRFPKPSSGEYLIGIWSVAHRTFSGAISPQICDRVRGSLVLGRHRGTVPDFPSHKSGTYRIERARRQEQPEEAMQGAPMSISESYYCSEVVPRCQFIARSQKLDEVLAQAVRHITEKHHVREITSEIAEVVRKAVHPTLAEPA
jgi:predicted small metal-binding protein